MISGGWRLHYWCTLRGMHPDTEEPFTLGRTAGRQPRRRRRRIATVTAAVLLMGGAAAALALADRPAAPAAQQTPGAAASATVIASSPPVVLSTSPASKSVDEAAIEACGLAQKTTGDAAYDPKRVRAVGQRAVESAVPSVRIQGTRLVELAGQVAKSDDVNSKLEMATAVMGLATYCLNNGLTTAY
jgi:hypothetical protein